MLPGREGWIEIYEYEHLVNSAYQHGPVTIVKETDKATVRLYKAFLEGAAIVEMDIRFYRPDQHGGEEHYYTIRLENARISSMRGFMPDLLNGDNADHGHMEKISFTYQTIIWTYEPDGMEFEGRLGP